MKVSVIIPVFNCKIGLDKTIESVRNQTYQDFEIVIVNDGSDAETTNLLKAIEDDKVFVYHKTNEGAAVARNFGFQKSNGQIVQFLDAGDVIHPDKFKMQIDDLSLNPNKLSLCYYMYFSNYAEIDFNKNINQSHFIYSTDDTQAFLINLWGGYGNMNFIQTNCWMFHRNLVEKVGGWRNYRCPDDDGEFFARLVLASKGIVCTKKVLNYYFNSINDDFHLSRNKNSKYIKNNLLTIDLKYKYILEKGMRNGLEQAIAWQYFVFAVNNYPLHKTLSKIAYNRFNVLNQTPPKLILGGQIIRNITYIFGWKIARLIRFTAREI